MTVSVDNTRNQCFPLTIDFICLGVICRELPIASGEDFTVSECYSSKTK